MNWAMAMAMAMASSVLLSAAPYSSSPDLLGLDFHCHFDSDCPESRDQLTSYEEGELLTILHKRSNQAIGMGQVLLSDYSDYHYHEILVEPSEPKSNRSGRMQEVPTTGTILSVFPNPAKEFVTLSGIPLSSQYIELLDASGRVVQSLPSHRQGNQIIDLTHLSSGRYQLRCVDESGRMTDTLQLMVR